MENNKTYSLEYLAKYIGAKFTGNINDIITGIASLDTALPGQISFLSGSEYLPYLKTSQATAIIVSAAYADTVSCNALIIENPYLGYAKISGLFDNKPAPAPGVALSASIHETATVHASASIAAQAVIDAGAIIMANVEIGAGCYIGENVHIGAESKIAANVTVHHEVILGERVIINSGVVIGADGFGFANDAGVWNKIAQIGSVRIGDDVEIGACSSIDRGALQDTIIEEGVKIDNQVMVAHNVHIGAHTAIAACVGISGSTRIGKHCTLAGGVGLVGHIEIADNVFITGMTMVTKSISEPGAYSSGTPMMNSNNWKKNAVRIRQLDKVFKRVQALEKQVDQLQKQSKK